MPRKHFHTVDIIVGSSGTDFHVGGSDFAEKRRNFLEPHKKVLRARGLLAYVSLALMSAKVVTSDPRITELHINLTGNPRQEPEYYRKGDRWDLIVDVSCSVDEIMNVPLKDESLGEFFIELIERAFLQVAEYSELPRDIVMAGCRRFRQAGYVYPYTIGEETIRGTRLKGRLQARAGCVSTKRIFTALSRGEPLLEVEIPSIDGADLSLQSQFGGFAWHENEIIVDVPYWMQEMPKDQMNLKMAKPNRIDLGAFPELRDLIRSKYAKSI